MACVWRFDDPNRSRAPSPAAISSPTTCRWSTCSIPRRWLGRSRAATRSSTPRPSSASTRARARRCCPPMNALTRTVLEAAVEAGCDPVVHISSTVALIRRAGTDSSLPLGDVDLPYSRSKIASERVARDLQDRGAPVVSVYPGSVYGPADPYLGEQATRLAWIARGRFPIWPSGGMHTVDVRDTAAVVEACLQPGRGPRRYVVPGTPHDRRRPVPDRRCRHRQAAPAHQPAGTTGPDGHGSDRCAPTAAAGALALSRRPGRRGARRPQHPVRHLTCRAGARCPRPAPGGVPARHAHLDGGHRPPTGEVPAGLTITRASTSRNTAPAPG